VTLLLYWAPEYSKSNIISRIPIFSQHIKLYTTILAWTCLFQFTKESFSHSQGRNEGGTIAWVPKSHKHFLQYSKFASERAQVRTQGRQICFLPRAPSNLVTPLLIPGVPDRGYSYPQGVRDWTSRGTKIIGSQSSLYISYRAIYISKFFWGVLRMLWPDKGYEQQKRLGTPGLFENQLTRMFLSCAEHRTGSNCFVRRRPKRHRNCKFTSSLYTAHGAWAPWILTAPTRCREVTGTFMTFAFSEDRENSRSDHFHGMTLCEEYMGVEGHG